MQRIYIARFIILSNVAYEARHEWSTRKMVVNLQAIVDRFIWRARAGKKMCAWADGRIVPLVRRLGGLYHPQVLADLQLMHSMVVAKWSRELTPSRVSAATCCSAELRAARRRLRQPQALRRGYRHAMWAMRRAGVGDAHWRHPQPEIYVAMSVHAVGYALRLR